MFQICGDVKAVGFPVQNVYKMAHGDENTTFEPLNLWTRERALFSTITMKILLGQGFSSGGSPA